MAEVKVTGYLEPKTVTGTREEIFDEVPVFVVPMDQKDWEYNHPCDYIKVENRVDYCITAMLCSVRFGTACINTVFEFRNDKILPTATEHDKPLCDVFSILDVICDQDPKEFQSLIVGYFDDMLKSEFLTIEAMQCEDLLWFTDFEAPLLRNLPTELDRTSRIIEVMGNAISAYCYISNLLFHHGLLHQDSDEHKSMEQIEGEGTQMELPI